MERLVGVANGCQILQAAKSHVLHQLTFIYLFTFSALRANNFSWRGQCCENWGLGFFLFFCNNTPNYVGVVFMYPCGCAIYGICVSLEASLLSIYFQLCVVLNLCRETISRKFNVNCMHIIIDLWPHLFWRKLPGHHALLYWSDITTLQLPVSLYLDLKWKK